MPDKPRSVLCLFAFFRFEFLIRFDADFSVGLFAVSLLFLIAEFAAKIQFDKDLDLAAANVANLNRSLLLDRQSKVCEMIIYDSLE